MVIKNKNYPVIWSPYSIKIYDAIIKYISDNFSDKEIRNFVRKTERRITMISQNPKLFSLSEKGKNKRKVVIAKQTVLYYQYKPIKGIVELLLFWDTRQNPKRLKY